MRTYSRSSMASDWLAFSFSASFCTMFEATMYMLDLLTGMRMLVFLRKRFSMITWMSSLQLWSTTEMPTMFGRCSE